MASLERFSGSAYGPTGGEVGKLVHFDARPEVVIYSAQLLMAHVLLRGGKRECEADRVDMVGDLLLTL